VVDGEKEKFDQKRKKALFISLSIHIATRDESLKTTEKRQRERDARTAIFHVVIEHFNHGCYRYFIVFRK